MRRLFTCLLILLSFNGSAQKIFGVVFNDQGDLLPYSSITIKGTTIGASANNRAKYAINVTPGTYVVICQHIGYATEERKVTITSDDQEIPFILKPLKLTMKELVVKAGGEDPAYAIIREAIKKRPFYLDQVKSFNCDLYTKDMMKLRRLPKKILGKKVEDSDRQDMGLDTSGQGIIYLSESVASVSSQQPDKFKMTVKSSRVSGSDGFGFTFPTFISLYQNNVILFTERLNPRGFVSPIADGALGFYKYKFLGSFWEDGKEVNSIQVIPRRAYEPLFSGIINITENDWRIHSIDLLLTKKSQLELIDTLQLTQFYVPANPDVWRVKNQLIRFSFNMLGIDAIGSFVNVYSNYDINPTYAKGYFDRIIIKYDSNVNKKTKAYWDTIRPMPLEKEEAKDYQVKDSTHAVQRDSARTKYTIDSLKKRQGKLNPLDVFWTGINRTHYSKTTRFNWGIDPLIKNLEYNPAEGLVLTASGYYEKYLLKSKTTFTARPNIRYGFNNGHLNGWLDLSFRKRNFEMDSPIKSQVFEFSGGRRVSQFNKQSPITPLVNSISTLLYGDNYLKSYENYFALAGFTKSLENGISFSAHALYEDRLPLNNTTKFTFFKKDSVNITPNYPVEKIPAQFNRHQAVVVYLEFSIQPGQRYIQFPRSKVSIGSKFPTFTWQYSKGIKSIAGSDVDFDRWAFNIKDDVNFKLFGLMKYKIGAGGFFNRKSVFIQDYQHFNGNRSLLAGDYLNSFQLSPYYANSTTASIYGVAFIEHHFNGALTNKIPFFRKLNWHLIAGTNTLFINKEDNQVEVFAGLENILKVFRVDVVSGFTNGKHMQTGIRIGFGGLIGGSVNVSALTGGNKTAF